MTQHDVPNPPTTLLGTFIVTVWHKPGTSIQEDKDKLRDGQHLVVGTPGRHLFGSGLFQARAQSIGEKRFAACQMLWVALLIVDARNPPAGHRHSHMEGRNRAKLNKTEQNFLLKELLEGWALWLCAWAFVYIAQVPRCLRYGCLACTFLAFVACCSQFASCSLCCFCHVQVIPSLLFSCFAACWRASFLILLRSFWGQKETEHVFLWTNMTKWYKMLRCRSTIFYTFVVKPINPKVQFSADQNWI